MAGPYFDLTGVGACCGPHERWQIEGARPRYVVGVLRLLAAPEPVSPEWRHLFSMAQRVADISKLLASAEVVASTNASNIAAAREWAERELPKAAAQLEAAAKADPESAGNVAVALSVAALGLETTADKLRRTAIRNGPENSQ